MSIRRYATAAEADRFWMQMPDGERIAHVWRLSQEIWRLRGNLPNESGLCRSVALHGRPLTGLAFEEAWADRLRRPFGDVEVDFIGRASFIRNKRATGRLKDLGDIEGME
jgi:hypothetical protein